MKIIFKNYINLALIVAIGAFVLGGNIAWAQKPLVLGISTDVSNIEVRKEGP